MARFSNSHPVLPAGKARESNRARFCVCHPRYSGANIPVGKFDVPSRSHTEAILFGTLFCCPLIATKGIAVPFIRRP